MSVINQISSANTFSDWLVATQGLIDHANYFSSNVELVISTNEDVQFANTYINSVANTINIGLENANTAANNANIASNNANTSSNNANTAASNSQTASNNANTAASNAQTASNNANTASSRANTASDRANTASDRANTASNNANTASNNANTAATNANTANTNAWAAVNVTVANVLAIVYPVGSIYINATNNTNPGTLLGFGTWVSFGAGRVPVGFNASDPLFDSPEETGGSKDAIVVSHNHSFSGNTNTKSLTGSFATGGPNQLANGIVSFAYDTGSRPGLDFASGSQWYYNIDASHDHSLSGTTSSTGSDGTNANLPPYITVYMWKRTA